MLFFPLYALYFADAGLSPSAISTLFVLWSVTGFVLEVPSGAWADAFSRRRTLALGGALRAAGFGIWTLWPSFAGFAAGFVLWGIQTALCSGTREAMLYDELVAAGAGDRYLRVLGRSGTVALLSMLAAMVLAAPAYAWGGYGLVGAASVAVSLASSAVALTFPETPRPAATAMAADASGLVRYAGHLRAGLREAARRPVVRHGLLIAAGVSGLSAADEYIPLLARDMGAATGAVPLLLLLPTAAMATASWYADRWQQARPRAVGLGLAVAGLLLAAGAVAPNGIGVAPAVGMAGIAASFALLQYATVLTTARLQDVIAGPSRATVLSVCGVATEVFALAVYAGYAIGAQRASVSVLVAALGAPMVVAGLVAWRWLPSAARDPDDAGPDDAGPDGAGPDGAGPDSVRSSPGGGDQATSGG